MDSIRVDVGVYTLLEVDLSEFDFTGIKKVIMTVKNNRCRDILFEREFSTAEIHAVTITPEESWLLRDAAEYDFNVLADDGKRYKNGDNGKIVLRRGCGVCSASQ